MAPAVLTWTATTVRVGIARLHVRGRQTPGTTCSAAATSTAFDAPRWRARVLTLLCRPLRLQRCEPRKMRSFRHRPVNGVYDDNAAIDSTENRNGSSNNNENNEIGPVEEGSQRRKRGRTQPKRPPPGQRIPIKPVGEEQFEFVNYSPKKDMGIGGQVTALLKHEYPSMIEESRSKKYYAKTWAHYDIIEDGDGMTAADHFKEEFWSIYSVEDDLMQHAEYVLDRLAAKQCRNMMYELRVDAVKAYYDMFLKQRIKDSEACKKLLRQSQYARVKPDWISEDAWRAICAYWCSPGYLKKRRLAQESRNQTDFAQNRGGSRPYAQTKQYLGKTYGPHAATDMNTFCSMKSGVKNCDSNGNSGPIPSQKAQQRVDDYYATLEAEHPDDCEQLRSDGQLDPLVLYKSSGRGLAHGRVPIANGAIRKADMKGSGRRTNATSQASSRSYQYLLRRNQQLEQNAQNSSHIAFVLTKHMKDVFEKLNMELPAEIADILHSVNANASMPPVEQGTESSHAGDVGFGGLENNAIEEDEGNANID